MRIALVEVIGYIIKDLASSVTDDDVSSTSQATKQINGLYDLLLERTLDVASYVRTKVLGVLSKLCDLNSKFPRQRLKITRAAVGALEDKVAAVRKSAVMLLTKLVLTHPYGLIHGGTLALGDWEDWYLAVKDELTALETKVGNAVQGGDEEGEDEDEDEDEEGDEEGEEGDVKW